MIAIPSARGRWLYHVVLRADWDRENVRASSEGYWPESASREGFIHASYRDAVLESARLYFPVGSARLIVRIDPRRLTEPPRVVDTPRGPMPHLHAPVPRSAIAEVYDAGALVHAIDGAPDSI